MKKKNRSNKTMTNVVACLISIQFILTALFAYNLSAQNIKDSVIKKNTAYIYWHEGKKKKRLEIIPDEIARFYSGKEDPINKMERRSVIIRDGKKMKIWKVKDESIVGMLKKGQIPLELKGNYSPVFKDSSGRKRTLPGNVLVYFNKKMTEEEVYKWAEIHNVKIIRNISKYNNAYLIKTPPGIESLNISNELNGKEGVVFSTPNWWTDIRLR